jgi:hypothetical protein
MSPKKKYNNDYIQFGFTDIVKNKEVKSVSEVYYSFL